MTNAKHTTATFGVLVLAIMCLVPMIRSGHPHAQTSDRYDIVTTRNVMVAARDGVRLATDVYAPGRGGLVTGRFPTIVERTPYNKDQRDGAGELLRAARLRVVLQDVRGRYRSEGRGGRSATTGPTARTC